MQNYQKQRYLSKAAIREEVCCKIFSERDRILGRQTSSTVLCKRKRHKPKIADFSKIQEELKYVLEHPIKEQNPACAKPSSMFISPSRKDLYSRGEIIPPVGNYNVSYNLLDKNVSSIRIQQPKPYKRKMTASQVCNKHRNPKKKKTLTISKRGLTFDKQLPRTNSLLQTQPKYEHSLSAIKPHISSPSLDKMVKRSETVTLNTNIGHVYSPNKELFMKKLSVNFDFSKMSGRNAKKIRGLSINTNSKSNPNFNR